jgi:hypothetical protein
MSSFYLGSPIAYRSEEGSEERSEEGSGVSGEDVPLAQRKVARV